MDYKGYFIKPYDQQPGKWRVRVVRISAIPLPTGRLKKLQQFMSNIEARTAVAAATKAMKAVDAAYAQRPERRGIEKFWRLSQADRAERYRPLILAP